MSNIFWIRPVFKTINSIFSDHGYQSKYLGDKMLTIDLTLRLQKTQISQ